MPNVLSGIPRIDGLFQGAPVAPLQAGDSDTVAVGAIQDLLTGLGQVGLPTLLQSSYGTFGPKTTQAVSAFQAANGLPQTGAVDSPGLRAMVSAPATDPRASQVYMTLVLQFPYSGMHKILSLVAQMEGVGKFAALNLNTDKAGLSFGIIQWAQRPGRLIDIVAACSQADRASFVGIFGNGDSSVADGLLAHLRKPNGGVDPKTGQTTDPAFDLVADPWPARFKTAALSTAFQQTQLNVALTAFRNSSRQLRSYAPDLASERAVAFMLDVANQFGDGGLRQIYNVVHQAGMSETDVLDAIADATVDRMPDNFKTGVRARRDHFLQTALLSNQPFADDALSAGTGV